MRRGQNPEFLTRNGKVIGINLGADFVSEHEWGINAMRDLLGINSNAMGVERLRVTEIANNALIYREGQMTISKKKHKVAIMLLVDPWYNYDGKYSAQTLSQLAAYCELMPWGDETICAAWDDSTFGILCLDDQIPNLQEIHQAFLDVDVAVGMADKRHVFSNPGLLIRRFSEIDQAERDDLLARQLSAQQLKKDAMKTGVEKKLLKAGKRWYALRPRYASEEEQTRTKYKVVFFLNPDDQQNNNFGWWTVEELLQWAKNEGPIPKKKGGN